MRKVGNEMDREKVISTFEKIISVCKEDRCDFVDLTFEDAEQILALLKEQEKPNGKCVNECECWDSAYERGKQDSLKEQEAVVRCKDCKKRDSWECWQYFLGRIKIPDDWFCADGERK